MPRMPKCPNCGKSAYVEGSGEGYYCNDCGHSFY